MNERLAELAEHVAQGRASVRERFVGELEYAVPRRASGGQEGALETRLGGGHSVSEGGERSMCAWTAWIGYRILIEHLLWARACAKGWGQVGTARETSPSAHRSISIDG